VHAGGVGGLAAHITESVVHLYVTPSSENKCSKHRRFLLYLGQYIVDFSLNNACVCRLTTFGKQRFLSILGQWRFYGSHFIYGV